jgi:pyruvate/2-oxoglutarate dehydrogenase complex dihydrolipoamide dehydrogenase (E3) component
MPAIRDRKRRMVAGLVDMEVCQPDGSSRLLRGANVVTGTGTRATLEPIPGLVESKPLTRIEALELDEIPAHLLVLGGAFAGLEPAQAMLRFGSRVSVIERSPHLAGRTAKVR